MKPPRLTLSGLLLAVLASSVALEAQTTANDYNTLGSHERQKGNIDAAIADFTKAVELQPDYAVAYNNRGGAERAKGDLGAAVADYTKAIQLKPDFAGAYNNRGGAKRAQGDFDGAIADYSKAIELNPGFAGAYNNRGGAKLGKRDLDGAIADYSKAVDLDPKHIVGATNLAAVRKLQARFASDTATARDEAVFARQAREIDDLLAHEDSLRRR